jgi:KDO2-lipid IV(A) lauroyltransferase
MLSRMGIVCMRGLGQLPLAWVRALGWVLGCLLYGVAVPRRRVVKTNLRLCFPDKSERDRSIMALQTFVNFAKAWLDRGWLWHGSSDQVAKRLKLTGARHELDGLEPVVIFAPHFVGLDAGWTALTQQIPRPFTTLYTHQSNKIINHWILQGRQRFGQTQLFGRLDGFKKIAAALRTGAPLYLLPDMNFDVKESVFVPFYGVPAATVPSLSRFAKLGRAKVVPVVTRMTPQGYDVEILPAWQDFPSDDLTTDTALMNQRLQTYIDAMPSQYYWVHKRFKDQPVGAPPLY